MTLNVSHYHISLLLFNQNDYSSHFLLAMIIFKKGYQLSQQDKN